MRSIYGVDHALGLPALYACVRLIAESMASLPLKTYVRPASGGPAVRYNGPSFFDSPSISSNLYDWIYQCMTSLLLQGNAWGLITGKDGFGYPTGIEWVPDEFVTVVDDDRQPFNPLKTRVYLYGRLIPNWREDLVHIRAFALAGRTEGISPLRAFALTVMNGLEAERYGVDWFAAGGFPTGTFRNMNLEIDRDLAQQIREDLTQAIRKHEPIVYGKDWEYNPIKVPPSEAQFIEATQMNATQMAAIFGLPPDRVGGRRGDSLTYNTVEQSTLQVIDALRPWMVRLETAFFNLIPANRYVRFNSDALLKTDLKTRTEIYLQQRNMGLLTIDEIRDHEDLPPLPGNAGQEIIPLEVMVAMARTTRGIPKSMLPQLTLEMDLAADKLEQLAKDSPPLVNPQASLPANAQTMLGRLISTQRDIGDLGTDDVLTALRELGAQLRRERQRAADAEAGPEYVGPWIPSDDELAALAGAVRADRGPENQDGTGDIVIPSASDVPYGPAMYTAHRIDEITGHLAHATERVAAAQRAAPGDARDYETEHVLLDLGQARSALTRLIGNVRQHYPAEAAELEKIEQLATPPALERMTALSSAHKAVTFAHLLQTSLYDTGHALRHAQVMAHETDEASKPLFSFDAQHSAHHLSGALEHVHKLAQHVRDNYPVEAKWLGTLEGLAKGPAHDLAQLKKLNGHAMNGSK